MIKPLYGKDPKNKKNFPKYLYRKNRQLTATDHQYYNPENYTELQFSAEKHLGMDVISMNINYHNYSWFY